MSPVTIIEYASMSCGHCAEFHKTIYPKLKADYIDTNKIRFIFREFPLDIKAAAGAMLARCVGKDDPNKYHAVVDLLFATQNDWVLKDTSEQLRKLSKQTGMSDEAFNACLGNQSMLDAIKQGQDQAHEKFKVEFHADLLRQRHEAEGRRHLRGLQEADRPEPQELSGSPWRSHDVILPALLL